MCSPVTIVRTNLYIIINRNPCAYVWYPKSLKKIVLLYCYQRVKHKLRFNMLSFINNIRCHIIKKFKEKEYRCINDDNKRNRISKNNL